jgi:hypothetical protein
MGPKERVLCIWGGGVMEFHMNFENINVASFNCFHGHSMEMAYLLVSTTNSKTQHHTNCAPEPKELGAHLDKATA